MLRLNLLGQRAAVFCIVYHLQRPVVCSVLRKERIVLTSKVVTCTVAVISGVDIQGE